MNSKKAFIDRSACMQGGCGKLIKSFVNAGSGIIAAVKGERNMRIHLAAAIAATLLGVWLGLDGREWAVVIVCCVLVMSLECLNTAVEAAVDLASPDVHPLAKKAKDCAAGAVLIAAIGAAVVGGFICGPRLLSLVTSHAA